MFQYQLIEHQERILEARFDIFPGYFVSHIILSAEIRLGRSTLPRFLRFPSDDDSFSSYSL
jgi:hypothetical protein